MQGTIVPDGRGMTKKLRISCEMNVIDSNIIIIFHFLYSYL